MRLSDLDKDKTNNSPTNTNQTPPQPIKLCKICGSGMLMIFGCGWDVDRLICGNKRCDYEEELTTTTVFEGDKQVVINLAGSDDDTIK